jgi:phosphopantothenoylcysteine decarboxylase / phosphopantothenate---cysteine ligase
VADRQGEAPEPADPGVAAALAGRHVLLGVSGGIAAYKAAALARTLLKAGASVQALLTTAATRFVGTATFAGITGRPAHADVFDEPDRIIHVRLAREADVAVFAPATANTIARFALGLADDLVTSAYLTVRCPVIIAPAMHTEMWEHPATQANVATLAARGAVIVGPDSGDLAGGDSGPGRLAEEGVIAAAAADALAERLGTGPLAGVRVVVTAGGTREPIDPVRFIGNRSSGKMGYALAAEAARRGALVDLVSGPTALPEPPGVTVHRVETALEMRAAVLPLADKAEVVVKAAAVADFRPATRAERKIKKDSGELAAVQLERNPDILAELGAQKNGRILVGFAAETDLAEEHGRDKLHRKGLDLIVVNRVDMADSGFAVDTNRAVLLGADGSREEMPLTTKAELARVVWRRIEALRAARAAGPSEPVT